MEMSYDDWLFEQDWGAATSGELMPSETGVGNSYDDYLFDLDWNYATSGQAMTNEVIQSIGFAVDVAQPYIADLAKVAGVSASPVEDKTVSASRKAETAESTNKDGEGLLSKINSVGKWMEQNKELTKILAGAVGGAAAASERRKLQASRMDEIRLADQLKQEANARYSDSIKGLKQPTGLISKAPLKYKSGANVFDGQGKLNRK